MMNQSQYKALQAALVESAANRADYFVSRYALNDVDAAEVREDFRFSAVLYSDDARMGYCSVRQAFDNVASLMPVL